jgi:hypothetical protein
LTQFSVAHLCDKWQFVQVQLLLRHFPKNSEQEIRDRRYPYGVARGSGAHLILSMSLRRKGSPAIVAGAKEGRGMKTFSPPANGYFPASYKNVPAKPAAIPPIIACGVNLQVPDLEFFG